MKLYIPTCTLNFNNIFATASISPKMFYAKRQFGNKRFYDVEPNSQDSFITLYSRIPYFEIDTDLENFPMVIEVETDDYPSEQFVKAGNRDGIDCFVSNQTIYLNPFHCFIIFFDYSAMQSTLTKAQQSLENKYALLYQNNMQVKRVSKRNWFGKIKDAFIDKEEDYFFWDNSYVANYNVTQNSNYSEDFVIDRIRGFVYCYAIGDQLSTSPQIGKLKSLARRMRNTLSAIVNSPDHHPTPTQDDSITNDINEFNHIYSQIDDISKANREIISSNLKGEELGLSKEQVVQCLKLNGVFDAFCKRLNLRREYNAFDLMSCIDNFSPESYDQVIRNLQLAVNRVELLDAQNRAKKAFPEMFSVSGLKVSIIEQFKKKFYEELVNSLIQGSYIDLMAQNGITDNEPLGLAYCGGAILKRIMGEQWNGSNQSRYINNLLSHLQSNEAFNLFSEQSEVLCSFAAFCQKGDNIDRLSEYLIQQGFSNYKLAYGLYGATRGFASLPKTFTKSLIDGDKKYLSDFICSLYKQLFSVTLSEPELPKESEATVTVESKIGATILQNINKVEDKEKKQEQIVRAVSETAKLETAVQSPRAFMYILDSIPNAKRTKAYKNLLAADFENDNGQYDIESFRRRIYGIVGQKDLKTHREKIDYAIELEALRDNPEAFLKILDNFLSPNDRAYKRIQSLLQSSFDSYESIMQPQQRIKEQTSGTYQRSIFEQTNEHETSSTQSISSIIYDDFAVERLRLIPEVQSVVSEICSMFKSFQQSYRFGYYYQNPNQYRRNNSDVIDHFCKWCLSDKNKKHLERNPENSRMMDAVKSRLMTLYPDK